MTSNENIQEEPETTEETKPISIEDHMIALHSSVLGLSTMFELMLKACQPKPGMEKVFELIDNINNHLAEQKEDYLKEITESMGEDKSPKSFAKAFIAKHYVEPKKEEEDDEIVTEASEAGASDIDKLTAYFKKTKK